MPLSLEFVRDMTFEVSLSCEVERRAGGTARCSTAFRNWENMLRDESHDARVRRWAQWWLSATVHGG